jgi:hypothetical protein
MNLTISQLKDIKKSLNVNYKQDHQKYAVRARIFAEIHCACENLCNSRIQNPGKIPEKTHKPSRTTPEDYWVCWKNPRRIPEESRKNKQDRRTIPEESRKTPGKTNKTIRNTPCVRKSLQKYAVRARIFATQEFRIPEESRKNPGRTPEKQTNLAEQSRKTIGSI